MVDKFVTWLTEWWESILDLGGKIGKALASAYEAVFTWLVSFYKDVKAEVIDLDDAIHTISAAADFSKGAAKACLSRLPPVHLQVPRSQSLQPTRLERLFRLPAWSPYVPARRTLFLWNPPRPTAFPSLHVRTPQVAFLGKMTSFLLGLTHPTIRALHPTLTPLTSSMWHRLTLGYQSNKRPIMGPIRSSIATAFWGKWLASPESPKTRDLQADFAVFLLRKAPHWESLALAAVGDERSRLVRVNRLSTSLVQATLLLNCFVQVPVYVIVPLCVMLRPVLLTVSQLLPVSQRSISSPGPQPTPGSWWAPIFLRK